MKTCNSDLVKRLINEVWNQGEIDSIDELCSEDFTSFFPDLAWNNLKDVKRAIKDFREAFPDWNEKIVDIIESDNKLVVRVNSSGTHLGILFGNIQPTGKKVSISEVSIFTIENGKIVEQRGYFDQYKMFVQLGLINI